MDRLAGAAARRSAREDGRRARGRAASSSPQPEITAKVAGVRRSRCEAESGYVHAGCGVPSPGAAGGEGGPSRSGSNLGRQRRRRVQRARALSTVCTGGPRPSCLPPARRPLRLQIQAIIDGRTRRNLGAPVGARSVGGGVLSGGRRFRRTSRRGSSRARAGSRRRGPRARAGTSAAG